jgi:hypothetical protein
MNQMFLFFRGLAFCEIKCLTTDWTTEVRFLVGAKDFPCNLRVETSFEAHQASFAIGTGGPFLE